MKNKLDIVIDRIITRGQLTHEDKAVQTFEMFLESSAELVDNYLHLDKEWKKFITSYDNWDYGVWVNPNQLTYMHYQRGYWMVSYLKSKNGFFDLILELCDEYNCIDRCPAYTPK